MLHRVGGAGHAGILGEKIGEGAFLDVHAWAPGQVVKLFKRGVLQQLSHHEAQVTRSIFATGAPAPDEVTLERCFGIVLHRLDGPALLQLSRSGVPERPRAYNAMGQSEYARLSGMSHAALTAAMEPYLPIACVIQLRWGTQGALRAQLTQRIEACLRLGD